MGTKPDQESLSMEKLIYPDIYKNLILLHVGNKRTDQPEHPRSLISAFIYYYLESKLSKLDTGKSIIIASLCS